MRINYIVDLRKNRLALRQVRQVIENCLLDLPVAAFRQLAPKGKQLIQQLVVKRVSLVVGQNVQNHFCCLMLVVEVLHLLQIIGRLKDLLQQLQRVDQIPLVGLINDPELDVPYYLLQDVLELHPQGEILL